jgi:hypothetical protein
MGEPKLLFTSHEFLAGLQIGASLTDGDPVHVPGKMLGRGLKMLCRSMHGLSTHDFSLTGAAIR